jgi:hypothetical protein
MSKFNVGDRVEFTGPEYGFESLYKIGMVGMVTATEGYFIEPYGGERAELVTVQFPFGRPAVISVNRLSPV